MSIDASRPVAMNKQAGEAAETNVGRRVDALGLVPDQVAEHYDAITTTLLTPSQDLPFVGICLVECGTPVEIKSVIVRYSDGARGRFYFRPNQHDALLEDAGVYLFAVCKEGVDRDLLALKVIPATIVDDVLDSWVEGGPGRSDYAQRSWTQFFAVDEVEGV